MLTLKDKINRILGNNVRLLLPSYWWKRLFGMVVDRIDEVHPIVDSSDALDKLDAPDGSIASIKGELFSLSDAYLMPEDEYLKVGGGEISLLQKCTPISSIRVYSNIFGTESVVVAVIIIHDLAFTYGAALYIYTNGIIVFSENEMPELPLCLEGQLYEENIRKVNEKLSEKECVIAYYELVSGPISNVDKFVKFSSTPGTDVYIKDEEWQPLARRKELDSLRTSMEEYVKTYVDDAIKNLNNQ